MYELNDPINIKNSTFLKIFFEIYPFKFKLAND